LELILNHIIISNWQREQNININEGTNSAILAIQLQSLTCRNLLRFIVNLQNNGFAAQRTIFLQVNAYRGPSGTFTSWLYKRKRISRNQTTFRRDEKN
jgi:cation transport regulator ChaC